MRIRWSVVVMRCNKHDEEFVSTFDKKDYRIEFCLSCDKEYKEIYKKIDKLKGIFEEAYNKVKKDI